MLKNARIIAAVALMLAVMALPTHAGSWSSAKTSGITIVQSMFDTNTNTFTWTLSNGSNEPGVPCAIIWSLQPFNVPAPISFTAPAGWTWTAHGWETFEIDANNRKYYAPPAIAPGQSAIFTYTFDPESPRINPYGSGYDGNPDAIGFITHIAEVVPGSGTLDGSTRWIAATNPLYGSTWWDRSTITPGIITYPPVPEPSSLSGLALGGMLALGGLRRRLRAA